MSKVGGLRFGKDFIRIQDSKVELKRLYWALLAVLCFCWGSNYTAIKIGLEFASPLVLAAIRATVSTAGMLPVVLVARRRHPWKAALPRNAKSVIILTTFATLYSVFFSGFWFIAELTIDPDTAAAIVYTYPLFVVFLSATFLSTSISKSRAFGTAIGFVGVFFVLTRGYNLDLSASGYGITLLFLASISCAFSMIVYKKYLDAYDPLTINLIQLALSSVLLLVWGGLNNPEGFLSASLLNSTFILVMVYLAFAGLVVSNVIWFTLLKEKGPNWVASWSFLIPVLAITIAFFGLGVTIATVQLAGVALVITGVYIANM